nr:MAG TPA: hypothetical protein [Caudoviricetes sp.]
MQMVCKWYPFASLYRYGNQFVTKVCDFSRPENENFRMKKFCVFFGRKSF